MKPSPRELRELGELGRVARPCGISRGVVHSSYCDFNECNMNATVGEWSLRDGKFRKPPATSPTPPTRPTPPGQPATCAVGTWAGGMANSASLPPPHQLAQLAQLPPANRRRPNRRRCRSKHTNSVALEKPHATCVSFGSVGKTPSSPTERAAQPVSRLGGTVACVF